MTRRGLALLTLLAAPFPAAAGEWTLTLDPEATEIRFTLGATAHTVRGSARLVRGAIAFDPGGGRARGEVVVDATSLETGNRKRDRDMHRKVLDSSEHPEIAFAAARLEGEIPASGTAEVVLHGTLRIHGGEHPVALPAGVHVEGDRLAASTRFTVPYVEWGMEDPSFFLFRVEDEVEVELELRGALSR